MYIYIFYKKALIYVDTKSTLMDYFHGTLLFYWNLIFTSI